MNIPDNGERGRSLLCSREALDKRSASGSDVTLRRQPYPASQHCGCILYHVANPALRLNRRETSYVLNPGYRAAPDETFWSAGGTLKTHLVPLFCGAGAAGCGHKTFPVRR